MPHDTTKGVPAAWVIAVAFATACGQSSSGGASGTSGASPDFPVEGSLAFVSSGVSEGTSSASVIVGLTSAPLPLGCSTGCWTGTEILLHVTGWGQTDAGIALAPGTYSMSVYQPDSPTNLQMYAEMVTPQGAELLTRNDALQATITLSSITSTSVTGSYDLTFTSGSVHATFEAVNCGATLGVLTPLDGGC